MLNTFATVLHAIAALGAIVCWTAGMYFWYLLNHSRKASPSQRRRRVILSFVAMLVFGLLAFALRALKESSGA